MDPYWECVLEYCFAVGVGFAMSTVLSGRFDRIIACWEMRRWDAWRACTNGLDDNFHDDPF